MKRGRREYARVCIRKTEKERERERYIAFYETTGLFCYCSLQLTYSSFSPLIFTEHGRNSQLKIFTEMNAEKPEANPIKPFH